MAKRIRAVRAWAFRSGGRTKAYSDKPTADFYAGFNKPEPVVIVPAAEYRAMRAAMRVAEAYLRGGKLNNAIYAYDRLVMAKKAKARTK